MKQSLQLKLGQSLTMTPQLQQAIRLLQLSTLELQTEIQEALETNPLLEAREDGAAESDEPAEHSREPEAAVTTESTAADQTGDTLPDDLPVDSAWEDTYDAPTGAARSSEDREFETPVSATEQTLHEYLTWQKELTPFSPTDALIAESIIDAIDDDGYLKESVEDIHQDLSRELDIDPDEVASVLRQVQNFDPPGVAARDLRECMLLQLDRLPADTPSLEPARRVIGDWFDLLAQRDYSGLMRRARLTEAELQQAVRLVTSLNPRPGSQMAAAAAEYIVPDVFVRRVRGAWRVELNPEVAPRLSINRLYAELAHSEGGSNATYLKNQLQEARWFIKSLKSRNETLLKVAQCIVDRQRGFFDHGPEAMRPMVMADIAATVEMHESTISRVTTRKYMHTPRGIFELKYFFSSHVSTDAGGECSATAIRAIIKKLVAAEKPNQPLSDSKLAELLGDQGIQVARRTIAKYRESLAIPPSNERKRLV